jgi:hypothetical protein
MKKPINICLLIGAILLTIAQPILAVAVVGSICWYQFFKWVLMSAKIVPDRALDIAIKLLTPQIIVRDYEKYRRAYKNRRY